MNRILSIAVIFLAMGGWLALALPQTVVPDASPARFVGEWVGLQSWAIADPPIAHFERKEMCPPGTVIKPPVRVTGADEKVRSAGFQALGTGSAEVPCIRPRGRE